MFAEKYFYQCIRVYGLLKKNPLENDYFSCDKKQLITSYGNDIKRQIRGTYLARLKG